MLTQAQLAARASGIGASEVAAALGLSRYVTPIELYLRKRGELPPPEETLPMRFGNAAEAFILDEFQRCHPTFALARAPDTMRRGPLLAHLDAWVPAQCNVQAKTARTREGWGESGSPDVPQDYLLQVQAEMLLAGVPVSYVPVLFGGADYDEFIIAADRELQELIEGGVREFWQRVQSGDPPEIVSVDDAITLYGRSSQAGRVTATVEVEEAVNNLREIKERRERLDAAEEHWKAMVLAALGERDTLVDPAGRVLCTWRASAPVKRFDAKAFESAHPMLYAQFVKACDPVRRLLVKVKG